MNSVNISKEVILYIKEQARSSENEIYGWLIGYQDSQNNQKVINAFACQNYLQQSYINAMPDPIEIQKISNLMPNGIGIIGIYHSHPFDSKVFHSHTDDKTLLSISKQLPNCVSIVTNGDEINFYQMNDQYKLREIDAIIWDPKIPKFIPIGFDNYFIIKIEKELIHAENLHILISNKIKDFLEENWHLFKLFKNKKEIPYKKKIYQYLNSSLKDKNIELKYPMKREEGDYININLVKDNSTSQEEIIPLKLDLTSLDLFYISDDKNSFYELKESIKLEIVNKSLIPKIFYSILDLTENRLIIPENYFFNLFGYMIKSFYYPLRVITNISKDYSINENFTKLSLRNKEILNRLYKMVNLYSSLTLNKSTKKKLKIFNEDIIEFSNLMGGIKNLN